MSEAIRDVNTGIHWDIEPDGSGKVAIASDDQIVSSTNPLSVLNFGVLVPKIYDYIALTYTDNNPTTVVYKTGGASGTTQATLTITYSGDNISTITRS